MHQNNRSFSLSLSLSPPPPPLQRWLKQHREEKEKASDGSVAMESGGRPKAPPTAGDEHDKENLHMSTPGTCTHACPLYM